MTFIPAYFDGTVCIPLEKTGLKPNQKVTITFGGETDLFRTPSLNKPSRLGFMKGQIRIPDNFDEIRVSP